MTLYNALVEFSSFWCQNAKDIYEDINQTVILIIMKTVILAGIEYKIEVLISCSQLVYCRKQARITNMKSLVSDQFGAKIWGYVFLTIKLELGGGQLIVSFLTIKDDDVLTNSQIFIENHEEATEVRQKLYKWHEKWTNDYILNRGKRPLDDLYLPW